MHINSNQNENNKSKFAEKPRLEIHEVINLSDRFLISKNVNLNEYCISGIYYDNETESWSVIYKSRSKIMIIDAGRIDIIIDDKDRNNVYSGR